MMPVFGLFCRDSNKLVDLLEEGRLTDRVFAHLRFCPSPKLFTTEGFVTTAKGFVTLAGLRAHGQ